MDHAYEASLEFTSRFEDAQKMETGANKYSQNQLELAEQFGAEVRNATNSTWTAAGIAVKMRETFPKRANKGETSWAEFCREILKRDDATVSAYVRGYKYALEFEPNLMLESPSDLPPVSLVAELASCRAERRIELHEKLFSGYYSAMEFRTLLASFRDPEFNEFQDDAPTDKKTTKPRPTCNRTTNKIEKEKPKPQSFPREALGDLIPKEVKNVQTFKAPAWIDVTELSDSITGVLIGNSKKLGGWTIVIIPPQGTEGMGLEEIVQHELANVSDLCIVAQEPVLAANVGGA